MLFNKQDLFFLDVVIEAILSVTKVNTHSSYSCYQVRPLVSANSFSYQPYYITVSVTVTMC